MGIGVFLPKDTKMRSK